MKTHRHRPKSEVQVSASALFDPADFVACKQSPATRGCHQFPPHLDRADVGRATSCETGQTVWAFASRGSRCRADDRALIHGETRRRARTGVARSCTRPQRCTWDCSSRAFHYPLARVGRRRRRWLGNRVRSRHTACPGCSSWWRRPRWWLHRWSCLHRASPPPSSPSSLPQPRKRASTRMRMGFVLIKSEVISKPIDLLTTNASFGALGTQWLVRGARSKAIDGQSVVVTAPPTLELDSSRDFHRQ